MTSPSSTAPSAVTALRAWPAARWFAAGVLAVGVAALMGVATAAIPSPFVYRPIPTPGWAYGVLAITAVLGGMVLATYTRTPGIAAPERAEPLDRRASVGGVLGFLAVGCPVCNKLVVAALGTTGAVSWFAPVQPLLALGSVVLLGVTLRRRLAGELACPTGGPSPLTTAPVERPEVAPCR